MPPGCQMIAIPIDVSSDKPSSPIPLPAPISDLLFQHPIYTSYMGIGCGENGIGGGVIPRKS